MIYYPIFGIDMRKNINNELIEIYKRYQEKLKNCGENHMSEEKKITEENLRRFRELMENDLKMLTEEEFSIKLRVKELKFLLDRFNDYFNN
jgi:hypothetical protein